MARTLGKAINRVLSVFACFFTVVFCLSVVIQIFSRTFLPKIPSWTEEVARYCFIYAVAFAAGLAVQTNSYVAVDIITNGIPPRFKRGYTIALNTVLCAFSVFFTFRSLPKYVFLRFRIVSTALEIPMQYIRFSLVILFGMLAITYLLEVIRLLSGEELKGGVAQ
jgi:TRAP-type C4-dicarboxylate transport system permease small subunit